MAAWPEIEPTGRAQAKLVPRPGSPMRLALPFALSALLACDPQPADSAAAAQSDAPTWNGDIKPIFQRSCLSCHGADGGLSGLPLADFAQARDWRVAIASAVSAGSMPPWLASDDCTDYQGDLSLSDAEKQAIVDWAEAGGPEGDPAEAAADVDPWEAPRLARVDQHLDMPGPYTPAEDRPDDYRCFVMEWPYEDTVWVTGYEIQPGNTDIVHHVIPYIIAPDDAQTYRDMDAADPGEGYGCYGGPGGDVTTLINTRWLGSWAPGAGAMIVPEGHGIRIPAGAVIVSQVHYNVTAAGPAPDLTRIGLQVETEPQKGALVQPWTDTAWVLGTGMDIPAQSEGTEHVFRYENGVADGSYTVHGAGLHMHTLGRSGSMRVEHADGTESCLLVQDQWDFDWQRTYWLQQPVTLGPGDALELRCTWDNPTDESVAWGDGTGDEMCLGITLITWE